MRCGGLSAVINLREELAGLSIIQHMPDVSIVSQKIEQSFAAHFV